LAELKARYGLPVMKAVSIREAGDLEKISTYSCVADRLLLDAKPAAGAELPGGNGIAFDWSLLGELDPEIDYMLSGGIDLANLASALADVHPAGIDVSSGVERAPGEKDDDLIRRFLAEARRLESEMA
jgi:phosphoribosylanthranilate isomerase